MGYRFYVLLLSADSGMRSLPFRVQDFRQCHTLIQRIGSIPQHAFPPAQAGQSRHQELAAKNVQRGLAARVQELSATFRKKQRVYMESEWIQCATATIGGTRPTWNRI